MNRTALKVLLVKHEGKRPTPYKDTTGHLTVGVGRNLDAVPFSDDEMALMLDNDVTRVWKECSTRLLSYGFNALDDARQHVLMDMVFNMGTDGVLRFQKMLAAVAARDFDTAAREMLNSQWAKQVGDRATELAAMMKAGA